MVIASILALLLLAVLSIFQFALVCGAPLGRYAWGGKHHILPPILRLGSLLSIAIYAVLAIFIASKVELWVIVKDTHTLSIGLWAMTAYLFVGVVMNAASRSKSERLIMTPVALILCLCFYVVAVN